MADRSIPQVGTRVSVQMFAGDVLAHQGLVEVEHYQVEHYQGAGGVGAKFSDGAGVTVVFSGDRSSVRMVLSAALHQLGPEVADSAGEAGAS
jgi:hypothetical protein